MLPESNAAVGWNPGLEIAAPLALGTIDDISSLLGNSPTLLARDSRRICRSGYDPLELVADGKRRVIHRPRPWLKSLQRAVHDRILSLVPISDAAYCQRGRGVIANARRHLARAHMVTLDIQNCFPSTRLPAVRSAWRRAGLDEASSALLSRLVTYQDMLPQGPPSSPGVLNLVLGPMDAALGELAERYGATYTRYMDDLCFSGDVPLQALCGNACRIVRIHGYRINRRKVRVWGPTDQHTVTKIVVSTALNPEPEYLAALAEEIHKSCEGRGHLRDSQLQGKIAWITALNPSVGRELTSRWQQRFMSRGRQNA